MGATAQLTTEPHRITEHRNIPGNLLRGALIGTVETIPGVSVGTVALVASGYVTLVCRSQSS